MSLWGNKDSVYSDGTIAISGTEVTGTGTTFNTAGLISAGDIITVGTGQTQGEAIIAGVTSARVLTLVDADQIASGTITGAAYNITQRPIYTHEDSGQYDTAEIFGVDATEVGLARTTAFAVAHAGWVGVTSYIDTHGNLRVKSEVLVAGSTITGDAVDDDKFRDS